jgi:hypothetical protein
VAPRLCRHFGRTQVHREIRRGEGLSAPAPHHRIERRTR